MSLFPITFALYCLVFVIESLINLTKKIEFHASVPKLFLEDENVAELLRFKIKVCIFPC